MDIGELKDIFKDVNINSKTGAEAIKAICKKDIIIHIIYAIAGVIGLSAVSFACFVDSNPYFFRN